MKASIKTARITPKKLNLIADMIRGKDAIHAMNILKFTPKKGAKVMGKLLNSAVSNAVNNFKQEKDSLYIKEIYVNKAPTLKRSVPISKGRMHPILKRNAHALIMLAVKEKELATKPKAEPKTKKSTQPTVKKTTKSTKAKA
jgi:large subunit ribosomal protein L22